MAARDSTTPTRNLPVPTLPLARGESVRENEALLCNSTQTHGVPIMNGKRIAGIVFLVLAGLAVIYGFSNLNRGPNVADGSGLGASHAIGSFLPAIILLIIGVALLQKPKRR